MSRASSFAFALAVPLLSTSLAWSQVPPEETLPPPPPPATTTAPPTTLAPPAAPAATPPAPSLLAPGSAWSLAAPQPQRAYTRERLRLLNQSLLNLPERSRSARVTEGIINLALGGGFIALGFLFANDDPAADTSLLSTLMWFQGGYSVLNGAVSLAWVPARERLPPVYGAMPMRTAANRRARLEYGEQALDAMARDSRLRRTLTGIGGAVLGVGTIGILYRDQIFNNEAMPEPVEFNYLMIGLTLVNVAANIITVFSQTEEERLRANYQQELQLLRESAGD